MSKRKRSAASEREPYVPPSYLAPGADGKYPVNDKLTRLDLAFPVSVKHLMPDPSTIPRESKHSGLVSRWFFSGLPKDTEFVPREGIEPGKALAHVKCIMGSFEPKHEHKEAACAFLLDQWFSEIKVPS